MSLESVLEKCTVLMNDEEYEQKKDLFIAEIEKQMKRFEKLLYTYSFEGSSETVWRMTAKEGEKPSEAKRKYFEQHKRWFAHKYLEMLCDLYDFKKDDNAKTNS